MEDNLLENDEQRNDIGEKLIRHIQCIKNQNLSFGECLTSLQQGIRHNMRGSNAAKNIEFTGTAILTQVTSCLYMLRASANAIKDDLEQEYPDQAFQFNLPSLETVNSIKIKNEKMKQEQPLADSTCSTTNLTNSVNTDLDRGSKTKSVKIDTKPDVTNFTRSPLHFSSAATDCPPSLHNNISSCNNTTHKATQGSGEVDKIFHTALGKQSCEAEFAETIADVDNEEVEDTSWIPVSLLTISMDEISSETSILTPANGIIDENIITADVLEENSAVTIEPSACIINVRDGSGVLEATQLKQAEMDDITPTVNAEYNMNCLNVKIQPVTQGMESYCDEISDDELALDFLAGTPGIRIEDLRADFKPDVISECLEDPESNLPSSVKTMGDITEEQHPEPELSNTDEPTELDKGERSTSESMTNTPGTVNDEIFRHEEMRIKECSVPLPRIDSPTLKKLRIKWEASLIDIEEFSKGEEEKEISLASSDLLEEGEIREDEENGEDDRKTEVIYCANNLIDDNPVIDHNIESIIAEFGGTQKRLKKILKQYQNYVNGNFSSIDKEMSVQDKLKKCKRPKASSLRIHTASSTEKHVGRERKIVEWLENCIPDIEPSGANQEDEEASKIDLNTNVVPVVSESETIHDVVSEISPDAEVPVPLMAPVSSETLGLEDDDKSDSDLTVSLPWDGDSDSSGEDYNVKLQNKQQHSTKKYTKCGTRVEKVDYGLSAADKEILAELEKPKQSVERKLSSGIPVFDIESSDDNEQTHKPPPNSKKSPQVYTVRDTDSDSELKIGYDTEDIRVECVKRRNTAKFQPCKRKISCSSSQPTTDFPSSDEENVGQAPKKARLDNEHSVSSASSKDIPVNKIETEQKENSITSEIIQDKTNASDTSCWDKGTRMSLTSVCKMETINFEEHDESRACHHPIPRGDLSLFIKASPNMLKNSTLMDCPNDVNNSQMSIVSITMGHKGRKNIRDIRYLKESKEARNERIFRKEAEKERLKLEALYKAGEGTSLKFSEDPLIEVDKSIAWQLKEHQREGVLFCWTSCFVKVDLAKEPGSGCILSHCMGLGKTLQMLAFLHTVLTHKILGVKSCLVLCPLNISFNWEVETKRWFKCVQQKVNFYNFSFLKERSQKLEALRSFKEEGGIGVIHYDRLRTWTNSYNWKKTEKMKNKNKSKDMPSTSATAQQQQEIDHHERTLKPDDHELIDLSNEVLLNPDILICDEGHILKNEDTILHQTISKIRTRRKIILTGTPMQNNLMEYYYMIQLVKPNVLGSKSQYCNQFVNPIQNGQHMDSSLEDISRAKRREFRLNQKTEGFVHRRIHNILQKFIPPKHEYAIFVNLTELQQKLYRKYILTISERLKKERAEREMKEKEKTEGLKTDDRKQVQRHREGLLSDYVIFQQLCCHPKLLYDRKKKISDKPKPKKNSNKGEDEEEVNFGEMSMSWFDSLMPPDERERISEDYRFGAKLIALRAIIHSTMQQKDKVLVFTKWISTLDVIQKYIDVDAFGLGMLKFGKHYFRIDGNTTQDRRSKYCSKFNESNNAKLFLITTKAGGLGVNLHNANRVVLFDVSMNPSDDEQSIFRVYRLGQTKTCYVYRLVTRGGMEEVIYNRCLVKLSVAVRVVDDLQMARNVSIGNTTDMYIYNPTSVPVGAVDLETEVEDPVLQNILKNREVIASYLEHQTLLQDQAEEHLNDEEKETARNEVVNEEPLPERKRGRPRTRKRVENRSEQSNTEPQSNILNQNEFTNGHTPLVDLTFEDGSHNIL